MISVVLPTIKGVNFFEIPSKRVVKHHHRAVHKGSSFIIPSFPTKGGHI
jgi:hypothetical protein